MGRTIPLDMNRLRSLWDAQEERKKGNLKKAEKKLRKILKKWPNDIMAMIELGGVLLERGHLEESEKIFRYVVKDSAGSTRPEAWRGLVETLQKQGRDDETKKPLEMAEYWEKSWKEHKEKFG
jgi:predicted Zn-dependent protease